MNAGEYEKVEKIQIKVFSYRFLPKEARHKAVVSIFNIHCYKPETKLTINMYNEIRELAPESIHNEILLDKLLIELDKKESFTFYTDQFKSFYKFLKDCKEFAALCESTFLAMDFTNEENVDILLTKYPSIFFKYMMIASFIYEQYSE